MKELSPTKIGTPGSQELFEFLSRHHNPFYYSSSTEVEEDIGEILRKGGQLVWARNRQDALIGFVSVFPEDGTSNQTDFLVLSNLTSAVRRLPFLAELIKRAISPYLSRCNQIVFSINPDNSNEEYRRFLIYKRIGFEVDPGFMNPNNPSRICLSMPLDKMMKKLEILTKGGEVNA